MNEKTLNWLREHSRLTGIPQIGDAANLLEALLAEHKEVKRLTQARPYGAKKALEFAHRQAEALCREGTER